jgi:ribonuclease Z
MASITFLGTGAAVTTAGHENAHMLVRSGAQMLLVDCPSNPIPRLQARGVDLTNGLTHLLLTHFHADHVSGLALMLQTAWLVGRTAPLPIYGLDYTLSRAELLLKLFGCDGWPHMFPVEFRRVPEQEGYVAIDTPDLRVLTSPVRHLLPDIAVRLVFPGSRSAVYSSDTEPSDAVRRLAHGVDLLIHEASGEHPGHTSAAQAGEVARQAGAKALRLIHYQTWETDPAPLAEEAHRTFGGEVKLAEDWDRIEF